MENKNKPKENEKAPPKSLYFTRIQKKIQTKYEEMQKKIEKSKSMDSLHSLMDISKGDEIYSTVKSNNFSTMDNEDNRSLKHSTSTVSLEKVKIQDAFFHYIDVCVKEEIFDNPYNDKVMENQEQESFLEVSSDISDKNSEVSETSSSSSPKSPKMTIRQRLGLKLMESRERRKSKVLDKLKDKVNGLEEKVKEPREKVERFILSNSTKQDIIGKLSKRVKSATVTIALIEASGIEEDPEEKHGKMIHCRIRFGTEKCKSKSVKCKDKKFTWLELFNLNMYDDNNMLEVHLWEKDTTLGKSSIDLAMLEKEKTHKMHVKLDELPNVEVFFLLTITGTNISIDNVDDYEIQQRSSLSRSIQNKVTITTFEKSNLAYKTFQSIQPKEDDDLVGSLTVTVFGAKGLPSQDYYCILELDNDRVQTHTEHKTSEPNWMKTFFFAVNDITSILEITIHDEKRAEDVAKLSILLLKIKNGEKRWFALKDGTQRERAKGNNPRVFLEMNVTWHLVRASIRVITPKEIKYLQPHEKLDRHIFARNLTRIKACIGWCYHAFVIIKTCFEWESRRTNVIALTFWMIFCWHFTVWMLPLLLLIPFAWYLPTKYRIVDWRRHLTRIRILKPLVLEEKPVEEKTSLIRKIQSLQDMVLVVQEAIGKVASFGESVKNLFNFTVPYISGLAIFLISAISLIMYLIPVKYTVMAWSMHKFLRKIVRPHRVPNNEILDLLSRVPDDETLHNCEELPLLEEEEGTQT